MFKTCLPAGRPIIGLCASGILIRALATKITDKHREPPVLAIAEDGRVVVPLLGGHHGGNELAQRIADHLGSAAAITTASDSRFGIALDRPPAGWQLANPRHYKAFAAALLRGAQIKPLRDAVPWLQQASLPWDVQGELSIAISVKPCSGSETELVYHPAVFALGVGCERGVSKAELMALIRTTLDAHHLAEAALAGVFSIDLKADEHALHDLAQDLDLPLRFFTSAELEAQTPRLHHPSDYVFRTVGCHGVAEAAALAAAGSNSELIVSKTKSQRATCAIARSTAILDAKSIGQARGQLSVVGIGPGDRAYCTPEAQAAIAAASDLVGYQLYLDLLSSLSADKTLHNYALGQERERVHAALELAAQGKSVALICSGDPGIYAMASLVLKPWMKRSTATGCGWIFECFRASQRCKSLQRAAAHYWVMIFVPFLYRIYSHRGNTSSGVYTLRQRETLCWPFIIRSRGVAPGNWTKLYKFCASIVQRIRPWC